MPTIKQMIDNLSNNTCGTSTVRGLSLQIIDEMNLLIPSVLVNIEDLNVKLESSGVNPYLQPAAKEALRRAITRRRATLHITSAYRTVAQQYLLRRWFEMGKCNIGAAARPGFSNHEDGLALDTPDFDAWRTALEAEKWDWLGDTNHKDPFHFTFVGGSVRDDIGDIGVKAFQQLWNKNKPDDQISVDNVFGPQTAKRLDQSPSEGFNIARLLKLVSPPMQGGDVRKVQESLVNVELLSIEDVNGIYDEKTANAIATFQDKRGLSIDRVVGPPG
ncbi:peptidoglycan-binding protein [Romeria aff. gracilis LEGE 07310]|uniref:Peptidoglycan-binding protein n=1 Tax=Vasconcelosia minhoensis LEGE 07310 TaxID=915328 RepID=A0A8J7DKX1_9CYAN|nr:peptidoglycan-binding protein [Romeria gracilis]MBE9076806.1 peptidoglycan-binding protein [Romeria aff. gracilis LEGE 07310]